MSRLLPALLVSFGLWVVCHSARADDKLNVVVFLIDDMGYSDCGCYGSKFYRTPNIDKLASQGVRFTNGYAACPVCSPTRASVMTGKYPPRVGITDWLPGRPDRPDQMLARPKLDMQLALEEVTLAEALKGAGYTTGHVGKWHLGGKGFGPEQQGFDINIAGDHSGSPASYFAPYRNKMRAMPGLEYAPEGEYLTDRLADEAVKFLKENQDRPFFLYLPHYAVHTPLKAKQELIDGYKPGKPGTQWNPIYAAMVESMDEAVGTVLDALDELKLSDNTLVIFTSDNGGLVTQEGNPAPATSNAPLRDGKGLLYEGGTRVPLIVRLPGVTKPGSVSDDLASTIDFFPTVLEACGVPSNVRVDGVSLMPALKGEKLDRDTLFWHYPHYSNQTGRPGGSVRVGNYKLIEFYEDGRRELYDLAADVRESRNLAEKQPELVKQLAGKLEAWRQEVGARMPTPNPNYKPNPQKPDGSVTMPARLASVTGYQLRYEPMPHKNTLGYWTDVRDTAFWDFEIDKPGTFEVVMLQGCGKGSGGSEVEVSVGEAALKFAVKDTGGFQNFEPLNIGRVEIAKAGRHRLIVKPKSKPGVAVMDLRQVTLRPVSK